MRRRKIEYLRPRNSIRWGRIFLLFLVCSAAAAIFVSQTSSKEQYDNNSTKAQPNVSATILAKNTDQLPPPPVPQAVRNLSAPDKVKEENETSNTTAPETTAAVVKEEKTKPANHPYADKTIEQITALIATADFMGKPPKLWGEHLPGVVSSLITPEWAKDFSHKTILPKLNQSSNPTVALTLDACGGRKGSSYDKEIIDFLRQEQIPATIFVTTLWIKNNEATLKELSQDPLFKIEAHGSRHKPASIDGKSAFGIQGTKNLLELVKEVEGNARDIEAVTGIRPTWFRSGTAYYDEIAIKVIHNLGLSIAGYSISADQGNTLPANKIVENLKKAKNGDIIVAHLNHPSSGAIRKGLTEGLLYLKQNGYQFVLLPTQSN